MEKFQCLAPRDDIENSYAFEAFDYAMGVGDYKKNDDSNKILNIAVTGPYGAGKSSIIKSYFNKNPQLHPLYLSMAKFNLGGTCTCKKNKKAIEDPEEKEIEQWLIQQLLFQKKPSNLPFSRVTRIKSLSKSEITSFAILLLFAIICFPPFFSIKVDSILTSDFYFWCNKIFDTEYNYLRNILTWLVIPFLFFFLWEIVKFARKINISKVIFKDTEITIGENDSLINKHLDELLYFFINTNNRVVVFEDLDRLSSYTIFSKLRDLNKIINSNEDIKEKVKFIFVMNDDIFQNTDRVKFFDFIIPIIPVISPNNAGDFIQELITKTDYKIFEKFDQNYFYNITNWMSDARIIKNTINEFLIYRKALKDGK